MTRPIRIVINGFGRIGRTVLRQLLSDPTHAYIQIVGINDIAPLETCAYLFRYDSVYGTYPDPIAVGDSTLTVGDHVLPFWNQPDLAACDLSGVDVVMECTGRAKTRPIATAGLDAGARAVLISGPSEAADVTVVMGANDDAIGDHQIVSNASCTANAIAPLMQKLDATLGVNSAHITTIHCYTGSQPTVDIPGPNLERSRAAAVSMIPTTTSAAGQMTKVLPDMKDRLSISAVRVPAISVSGIDAVVQLRNPPRDGMITYLRNTFAASKLVGLVDDPVVSTDMRARSESLVIGTRETMMVGTRQLRLFGWYDNEWGFSARMIDMARKLAARG